MGAFVALDPDAIDAEEERQRISQEVQRQALEGMLRATSSLDVMAGGTGEPEPLDEQPTPPTAAAPAFSRSREGEERAARIAEMAPGDWARHRDGVGAGAAVPDPHRGPVPEPPASYRVADVQRARSQAQGPAGRADLVRQAAQARREQQRPVAVDGKLGEEARLRQEAESAVGRNRMGAILRALGGVVMRRPDVVASAFDRVNDPMREYEQGRHRRAQEARQVEQDQMARERAQRDARQAEQRLAQQRTEGDRRLDLQERGVEAREMDARRRMALMERQSALLDAQRRAAEGDAAAQAQMMDPSSPVSHGAQDILLDAYQQARGEDLPEELVDAVRSQSARALQDNDAVRVALQGQYSTRRASRGGGGGAGASARRAADLAGKLRRAGYSEEQVRQQLESLGLTAPESGVEILPGVRSGIDTSDTEVRGLRDGFAAAASRADSLRALSAIGQRYGASARIDPRASAAVAPHLMALRAMAADIQGTGVINPSEVETINASLPDPRSVVGMTFGTLQEATANWRRLLESKIAAGLRVRGVDDGGVQRAIAALRAGGQFSAPASQPARGGSVRVRYQGRVLQIPRARLEEARRDGAEVIE